MFRYGDNFMNVLKDSGKRG